MATKTTSKRGNVNSFFVVGLSMVLCASVVSTPASAQDRGTGFPTGSQDTRLPNGVENQAGNAAEIAEQSFKDGLSALVEKDYNRCRKEFETVVELAPTSAEGNYYLGVCTARDGEPERAVKYFDRAIEELPDFVEAREQLALVQVKLGDRDAATAQLEALRTMQSHCSASDCDTVVADRLGKAVSKVEAALA